MTTRNEPYLGSPDNPRTAAFVCYITFIGWLIAYFALYRNNKTPLVAYHLRQTLLLHIISLAFQMFAAYTNTFSLAGVVNIVIGLFIFCMWLVGLIGAVNGKEKPMPIIGEPAQRLFSGI